VERVDLTVEVLDEVVRRHAREHESEGSTDENDHQPRGWLHRVIVPRIGPASNFNDGGRETALAIAPVT